MLKLLADAMYRTHRINLDEYKRAFQTIDGQAGAIFAVNGQVLGFDIFDCPKTLAKIFPMLVESFALDAIDSQLEEKDVPAADAKSFLERTAALGIERFPAVGEGEDLRLEGDGIGGGALVVRKRVIHLCAFRVPNRTDEERETHGRMLRASLRRRDRV